MNVVLYFVSLRAHSSPTYSQTVIPAANTTYWCAVFELPPEIQSSTKHMIRVRFIGHGGYCKYIAMSYQLNCGIMH